MGLCCLPPESVKMGLLLFTPGQSQTNSEQQEKTNSRVKMERVKMGQGSIKMGFCSYQPDRVKLAVNSKKKQTAESKWAKGQDGLLLFTP